MEDITTKAEDTLTLKDGRLISPSVLTHPFKPLTSIEASQIVQIDYDHIKQCLDLCSLVEFAKYSANDTDFSTIINVTHQVIFQ